MWPADAIGQKHVVSSKFGPFDCALPRYWERDWRDKHAAALPAAAATETKHDGGENALEACRAATAAATGGALGAAAPGNTTYELEVGRSAESIALCAPASWRQW